MKKIIEIECCSECPHSNMATTTCLFDGEKKDLPDNVLFDRIIPEWCKLESKPSQPILTDKEIEAEAERLISYRPLYFEKETLVHGLIEGMKHARQFQLFRYLTDEEIEIEAEKYAIKRHGLGEEWQPDRGESVLGFVEGAKFFRDKLAPIKIENVTGEIQPNPEVTITGEADPRLLNQLRIHWKWLKNKPYKEVAMFCTAFCGKVVVTPILTDEEIEAEADKLFIIPEKEKKKGFNDIITITEREYWIYGAKFFRGAVAPILRDIVWEDGAAFCGGILIGSYEAMGAGYLWSCIPNVHEGSTKTLEQAKDAVEKAFREFFNNITQKELT